MWESYISDIRLIFSFNCPIELVLLNLRSDCSIEVDHHNCKFVLAYKIFLDFFYSPAEKKDLYTVQSPSSGGRGGGRV